MNPLRTARQLAQRAVSMTGLTPWVRLHNGLRLRVDVSNSIGRSIFFRRRYEAATEAAILRHLAPGDTFIDVGANVGYFSIVAGAHVGPAGRVLAVEPNHTLAGYIAESARRNGLACVVPIVTALGSETGTATLQMQASSGVSFIGGDALVRPNEKVVGTSTVTIETLDGLLARTGSATPAVVKIDVEGLEAAVLAGSPALLEKRKTAFIMENVDFNLDRYGAAPDEVYTLMKSFGYQPFSLGGQSLPDGELGKHLDLLWKQP